MKRQQLHSADLALIIILGVIALCSGGMALLILLTALLLPDPEYITVVPVFLGPTIGSLGAALMVYYRQRLQIKWIPLLVAMLLWFIGATLLAFTGFAVFDVDEPSQFTSNLGFSLGLCLVPGVILAGMGVLLYWSDAVRNRPNSIFDEASHIQTLKEDEQS